jgi:hypothetical protein
MVLDTARAARLGGFILLLAVVAGVVWWRHESPAHSVPRALAAPPPVLKDHFRSYRTNFPVKEERLAEGGIWINGKAAGLDWTDVATDRGLAHGTESGTEVGDKAYDDSTALVGGPWKPDQTVEARVHCASPNELMFEEVELRLRSSLSAHRATGYEVMFRCLKTPQAYASIARWDGPLGKFTYLVQKEGLEFGVADGDLVKATIAGDVITGYINGVQLLQARDATFPSGSPGIGFWLKRQSGIRAWLGTLMTDPSNCGFTSFAAWD